MKAIRALFLFGSLFIYSTCTAQSLDLKIDSVYIDEQEKGDTIREQLMIIYYCTVLNSSDSAIDIPIQNYLAETRSNAHCYLIHNKDTLDLFLAAIKKVKIEPHAKISIQLINNTIEMVDLFERRGYTFKHRAIVNGLSANNFLKAIARDSFIFIQWPGFEKRIIIPKKIKLRYRKPNDNTMD